MLTTIATLLALFQVVTIFSGLVATTVQLIGTYVYSLLCSRVSWLRVVMRMGGGVLRDTSTVFLAVLVIRTQFTVLNYRT